MQKEIGSVLEFAAYDHYAFPEGTTFRMPFMNGDMEQYRTYFFQNARNAIESLAFFLKNKMPDMIFYLPDFVCDTVPEAFERAGVRIRKYHIDRLLEMDVEWLFELEDDHICVFICHYFGKPIQRSVIHAVSVLKEKGIKVIEDITMSLYSEDMGGVGFGDYIIGSIRKWLPIPDGGFITVRKDMEFQTTSMQEPGEYARLYTVVQSMKREYVRGGYVDSALKDTYMQYYKEAVKILFSDYTIREISDISRNYILNNNYHEMIERRCENYDYLYSNLLNSAVIHPFLNREGSYVPFMFTVFCDCRDDLMEYLIAKDIYCNVHWREKNVTNADTQYLCDHMLSIPCDQRYTIEDMRHIVNQISDFEKQRMGE